MAIESLLQSNVETSQDGMVECGGYRINTNMMLPQFNIGNSVAYEAYSGTDKLNKLIALVQEETLPSRVNVAKLLVREPSSYMMRAYHEQPTLWSDGAKRRVLIQQYPNIPKLFPTLDSRIKPMPVSTLITALIEPFGNLFNYMKSMRSYHGFIRPDNMYWDGGESSAVLFGPAHAGPPLYYQDYRFLNIQSTLCEPILRGDGDLVDDLYAFGVCIISVLLGYVPASDMTPQELLEEKILRGSYTTYLRDRRFKDTISELLRGILHDNVDKRWNEDEFSEWLLGRKQSPAQQFLPRASAEPIIIDELSYYTLQDVYVLHQKNWQTIKTLVETGRLFMWIRKNFSDMPIYGAMRELLSNPITNTSNKDHLTAMVLMTIWPEGGVVYIGKNFRPDGIVAYVSHNYDDQNVINFAIEIYEIELVEFWFALLPPRAKKKKRHLTRYNNFMDVMLSNNIGAGITRAMYENNVGVICQSPLLSKEAVTLPQEIIPALESLASTKQLNPNAIWIDEHFAGFIMAHLTHKPTGEITKLFDPKIKHFNKLKAQMAIFVILWKEFHRDQKFFATTKYLAIAMRPICEQYYSGAVQKNVEKMLLITGKKGDFNALLNLVEDQSTLRDDAKRFLKAQDEYDRLCVETRNQFMELAHIGRTAAETGGELSMVVSGLGSAVITVVLFVFQLFF